MKLLMSLQKHLTAVFCGDDVEYVLISFDEKPATF